MLKKLALDEAPAGRRQGLRQHRRLSRVSRLRDLRHRRRAGRLCELCPARGLHGARKLGISVRDKIVLARYGGQFPRPEGPERPEARGAGHLDLLRSRRRRLRQGRRLSRGPVSPRLGDPARERPVPLARPGRSLDPGGPVGQGRRSPPRLADRTERLLAWRSGNGAGKRRRG